MITADPKRLAAVLFLAICAASGAQAGDDNPRGWHLAAGMTSAERAATLKVMAILEAECPALAETNWHAVPPYDRDPHKRIVPTAPTYPKPDVAWGGPIFQAWKVEVPLIVHSPSGGTIAITAGGPADPGLTVLSGDNYLGADICNLTEDRSGGYRFRSVPALSAALSDLSK